MAGDNGPSRGPGDEPGGTGKVAARLLAEVHAVAAELRPHLARAAVTLDAALDRDLGFDSLGRVELMVRVERAFDVALPESVFADAETVRDLLGAVTGAAGAPGRTTMGRAKPAGDIEKLAAGAPAGAEVGLPTGAETLTAALDWHADAHPDRPHIRLYDDDTDGEAITYGALRTDARAVAAGLQLGGLEPGAAVILMLPTGRDYFVSFFGVLYAGAVPVPVYPPGRPAQIEEHLRRHAAIVANCRARAMITVAEAEAFAKLLIGGSDSLSDVATPAALAARAGAGGAAVPVLGPGDTAFIQYTSGSTGDPKGVQLSHANLMANIRVMGEALESGADDVFVSWLPLYHDMGLIGAWLGNLYHGHPLLIMPPLSFLSRPERWLKAIHRARGTMSAAPNFAYELCVNRIRDADLEDLDLSSWRVAMNGAEAVNPDTIAQFTRRFQPHGFKADAMMPVFGLAENSVGLTFPPLGRGAVIDVVERATFVETGRAVPAADAGGAAVQRFVNCGRPLPRHQIRVVDADGRELPEREEGRLQFKGPSATAGYFRNAEATRELFDGEWLNSGDLGYIAAGDLHISGRTKDVIIRAGRNIYPVELEAAVGKLDGIARGNVAVFGSADPDTGTERLVVLAESRKRDDAARDALKQRINELALDLAGTAPDEIVLAPPRTVLKTSSGKVRRAACRDLFERGLIGKPAAAVWWQITAITLAQAGPRLRKGMRRLAVAAYGAYGWALMAVVMPLAWLGALVVPTLAARWRGLGLLARGLARLMGLGLAVDGAGRLPPGGQAAVYVSNHASYLDAFVLAAALPRPVSFVTKAELAASPLTRLPLSAIGAQFVERFDRKRGLDDAKRVTEAIAAGVSPLFFAEGTLSRMPGLLPFHMGAFAAAVDAGVTVVPVVIRGTRSVLRDGSWMARPGRITVRICDPVAPPAAGDSAWARAVGLRDRVRAEILRHSGEPDLGREDVFAEAEADRAAEAAAGQAENRGG